MVGMAPCGSESLPLCCREQPLSFQATDARTQVGLTPYGFCEFQASVDTSSLQASRPYSFVRML